MMVVLAGFTLALIIGLTVWVLHTAGTNGINSALQIAESRRSSRKGANTVLGPSITTRHRISFFIVITAVLLHKLTKSMGPVRTALRILNFLARD